MQRCARRSLPRKDKTPLAAVAFGLTVRTPELSVDRLIELELRQHFQSGLGSTETLVTRLPPWSQIVLPGAIADRVAELMGRMRRSRPVYDS
jgi:hypothetical protein